ncbi:hypothetical protein LMH73_025305 [Vibrio splendidus]|nr:hypothetical protein [Vibrio splendidus]MCC4882556.1 hypothetical protein [Vibrio splendidus]
MDNTEHQDNLEETKRKAKVDNAIAWLKSAEGKPPVIASRNTQLRHESEWQNMTIIHKDDKEGLRNALEQSKKFKERYGIK